MTTTYEKNGMMDVSGTIVCAFNNSANSWQIQFDTQPKGHLEITNPKTGANKKVNLTKASQLDAIWDPHTDDPGGRDGSPLQFEITFSGKADNLRVGDVNGPTVTFSGNGNATAYVYNGACSNSED